MMWATIIIGVPVAIISFIGDHFREFGAIGGVLLAFYVGFKGLQWLDRRYPGVPATFGWSLMSLSFVVLAVALLFEPQKRYDGTALEWLLIKLGMSALFLAGAAFFGYPLFRLVRRWRKFGA
jgi:hypothetical protein